MTYIPRWLANFNRDFSVPTLEQRKHVCSLLEELAFRLGCGPFQWLLAVLGG